ncbi:MAG: rhodanese-like domain-containing protein [Sulfurovaceae bacterium]|nr:rhodanese-like domain-containing protein [Sulfurovaceae bacterium]
MVIKLSNLLIAGTLSLVPLYGVEYDGEKSYMIETKYDICVVAPQVDEAIAKGVKVIDADKAKGLYDQKAYFYDARDKRHYTKEHIKGAKQVYFDLSKAEYIVAHLPSDKDEALVFYCYGESCANSYEAALAVRKLGYKNIYWLINGFSEWKEKGYPLE